MSESPNQSNVHEFSVGELAFSLKRTLEDNFGHVRVRGELSRISVAASGHMYSSLKDDAAVIDAVCWKGTLNKLSVRPEEGLEVICTGKISSYPKSSKYQLIIESMELAGEGALLKMLEERRKKLTAEGLFAQERKKPLPFLPRTIGVVTSPTGAVIRDILHRLADRMPSHVLVWPVMVQGEGAAVQITAAIEGFDALTPDGPIPRPDILIVARGGGSLEDLMAFNEENVVRAAANCSIPIISAVGHETDTTLIDYAADLRAPTPTGAAEMAVPVRANLLAQMLEDEQRLLGAMTRTLSEYRHKLDAQSKGLGDPAKLLDIKAQNLDHVGQTLGRIYTQYLSHKRERLITHSAALRDPKALLNDAAKTLTRWSEQLTATGSKITQNAGQNLKSISSLLEAYSFENTLQRGYALVRAPDGTAVTSAAAAQNHAALSLQFKNNETIDVHRGEASLTSKQKTSPQKKKKTRTTAGADQKTLF